MSSGSASALLLKCLDVSEITYENKRYNENLPMPPMTNIESIFPTPFIYESIHIISIAAERIQMQFIASKFNSWAFMRLSWFQASRLSARKLCRLPAMSSHIHFAPMLLLFRSLSPPNPKQSNWTRQFKRQSNFLQHVKCTIYINSNGWLAFIDS